MIDSAFKGLGFAFVLAITIGPSFFALLQTSIQNGLKSGIILALGIFTSDVVLFSITYLGASQLFDNPSYREYIELAGGVLLVAFGLIAVFQNKKIDNNILIVREKYSITYLKGFLLNTLNPAVFILWLFWVSLVSSQYQFSNVLVLTFFGSALLGVLFTDIIKALLAISLRKVMTPVILSWANRTLGIILFTIGLNLLTKNYLLQLFYRILK